MAQTALAKRPQTARPNAPRPATRVVVREVAAPRRRRSKGGAGGRGMMNTGITMQRGIVAYALGAAQRAGSLARVPTFGQFGALATISVAAGFMSKGGGDLASDVALCAGIVALNEVGREGMTGTPAVTGVGAAQDDPYKVEGDDD